MNSFCPVKSAHSLILCTERGNSNRARETRERASKCRGCMLCVSGRYTLFCWTSTPQTRNEMHAGQTAARSFALPCWRGSASRTWKMGKGGRVWNRCCCAKSKHGRRALEETAHNGTCGSSHTRLMSCPTAGSSAQLHSKPSHTSSPLLQVELHERVGRVS